MKDLDRGIGIIFYGPPGSGKGTQAKLLADKFGFFHFDTGDFLRRLIHNPQLQGNRVIQRERRLNDTGKLQTPSFVLRVVSRRVKELLRLGQKIIFSGSPRTLLEAVGDSKRKGLIDILKDGYGKKNLFIFVLSIPEKVSIERNKDRLVCSVCKASLLGRKFAGKIKFKKCPFCGGKIIKRIDDDKKVILTRLREYRERTELIFKELKARGYRIHKISGMPAPYRIHEKLLSYLTK